MRKRYTTESRRRLHTTVALLLVCVLMLTGIGIGALSTTAYAADTTIMMAPGPGVSLTAMTPRTANGPYAIEDEYGTVWTNGTEVEIFRSSYENGNHDVTVAGKDGGKVIAPGTENTYTFAIKNNYAHVLEYKLTAEAFFTGLDGTEKLIPVEAKLQGKLDWLLGDEAEFRPVLELNGAEESSHLYSGEHALYTLQWRWPFEQDLNGDGNIDDGDALDTWLATQPQDISLTIRIIVQAADYYYAEEPVAAPVPSCFNDEEHFAYIFGLPDGCIHPEAEITRGEIAAIIYRLLWEDIREKYETTEHPYGDMSTDAWYANEVACLTAIGFLKGYPDGNFCGTAPMTRAELAALLSRISEKEISEKGKTKFTDIKDHWAAEEIMAIEDLNWVYGYPDGTFRPDQNVTRAEAIAMINRVLHRQPEKHSDLLPDMKTWPDNANKEAWYYMDIQEATNGHAHQRLLGTREKWIALDDMD